MIYISREKLKELLKDPKFVAFAPPGGKITGGVLGGKRYQIRRGAE